MEKQLLVIVGQTASGKSRLAMELAQKFDGEIICADSRTIYKGMDIGTAKPTAAEQQIVSHYLLDIVSPDQEFSVADFQTQANQAIEDIWQEGRLPILVGGTGLYINSVIYNYRLGGDRDDQLRSQLEKLPDADLRRKAEKLEITEGQIDFKNRRHLVRAIERGGMISGDNQLRENCLVLGMDVPAEELKARIKTRIDKMIADGLEKEVRALSKKYGFEAPGMNAIGYREWQLYLANEQSIEDVYDQLYKNTWQYARRQKTWFRRDQNIRWATSVKDTTRELQQFLIQ